jgi:hypothetical protein
MPRGQPAPEPPPADETPPATETVPTLDLGDIGAILSLGGDSSDGGGGAAPVDPTVSAASSFYFQLWGVKPPEGYVENFLDGSTDLFDFITFQLSRPTADNQIFFRDRFASYAQQAAAIMARR